jgi:hypothetical protein
MKAQNANPKNRSYIKSVLIVIALLFISVCSKAQDQSPFPFKAGSEAMAKFFKDSVSLSPDLQAKRANGTVVIKFSADANGAISRIIVYYADDIILAQPIIEALRKSANQWVIPGNRMRCDFEISFTIGFNLPASPSPELKDQLYAFYADRRHITANNEIPLGQVTLLPNVMLTYEIQ